MSLFLSQENLNYANQFVKNKNQYLLKLNSIFSSDFVIHQNFTSRNDKTASVSFTFIDDKISISFNFCYDKNSLAVSNKFSHEVLYYISSLKDPIVESFSFLEKLNKEIKLNINDYLYAQNLLVHSLKDDLLYTYNDLTEMLKKELDYYFNSTFINTVINNCINKKLIARLTINKNVLYSIPQEIELKNFTIFF